jgi:hypothetical protein
VTSHAHDPEQSTVSHAFDAPHRISHAPGPHAMSSHEFDVRQPILHELADEQSMSRHALLPEHVIVQAYPLGQVTAPQLAGLVQAMLQVIAVTSQPALQIDGQLAITQ